MTLLDKTLHDKLTKSSVCEMWFSHTLRQTRTPRDQNSTLPQSLQNIDKF